MGLCIDGLVSLPQPQRVPPRRPVPTHPSPSCLEESTGCCVPPQPEVVQEVGQTHGAARLAAQTKTRTFGKMMKTGIVISWVPFKPKTPRANLQLKAWKQLVGGAPKWCSVRPAVLPDESDPNIGVEPLRLPRRADHEGLSPRALPFMKDVIDAAFNIGEDVLLGGFFNSDIFVTPSFWPALKRASASADIVFVHRTNIRKFGIDPKFGKRVRRGSSDGFFITKNTWETMSNQIPDFILGQPAWDKTMVMWSEIHPVTAAHLEHDEILHINTRPRWHWNEPGSVYNRKLKQEVLVELYEHLNLPVKKG